MKIQCVVIDKSPSQKRAISKFIDRFKNLELIATFSDATAFKAEISSLHIELLILDINMPVIDGIELLKFCKQKPEVIFMANSKKDAYKAIKHHPVDYLVKPIDPKEFEDAIVKAVKVIEKNRLQNQQNEAYIHVTSDAQKQRINLNDILWIEALGDYIRLITISENVVMLSSLKSFEKELPKDKFMRIHKSYIVNLEKIETFDSKYVFIDSEKIPLSRNKKVELDSALTFKSNQ